MAVSADPLFPPPLTPQQSHYLLSNLNDWAIANGLAVRPATSFVSANTDPHGVLAATAPVTLFPSPYPRACFKEALSIQKAFNELYAAISRDEEWLGGVVEEIIEVDDFIGKLWEIHLAAKKEGYAQNLSLGLFRSDYMIHVDRARPDTEPEIKQVEFNTIASSFGGLSSQVSSLHRHLSSIGAYPPAKILKPESFPPNRSVLDLAAGLFAGHQAYGPCKTTPALPTCILFVVQPGERNVFDQRPLECKLRTSHGVPVFRLALADILSQTSIPSPTASDRPLVYTPPHSPHQPHEVTLIYFRAGYSPDEYPQPSDWEARLHLERSSAIKCPSILTHLAGSKKVQQVLATPGSPHLARFIRDPIIVARLSRTFATIHPLDTSPAGLHARSVALDPQKAQGYVLKPQREGGGNNIYRQAIPPFLHKLPESHWKGYILMELIEPPVLSNSIIRNGEVKEGPVICELGVYGTCLWRHSGSPSANEEGEAILWNEEAGYLLRTKGRDSEEGGVAAGFGSVDSVCLVDS